MKSNYLPKVSFKQIKKMKEENNIHGIFDLLSQPLQQELNRRKTFDFLDELSAGQKLVLTYDYMQNQVQQGGFIQLIQNGYVGLLLPIIEGMEQLGITPQMRGILDDVLK